MKKSIIFLIVVIIAVIAYYFLLKPSKVTAPTSSANEPVAQTQDNTNTAMPAVQDTTVKQTVSVTVPKVTAPASVTVHIKNFAFSPATLSIKAGTKVTWINDDSAPHTVTSDSGSLLDSATLSTGQSFSFVFSNVGTMNYHCAVHPMMKGKVVVN